MNIPTHQITGLVLSGGRGTRMGHVDKGLLPIDDITLIEASLRRLQPQVGRLMINANTHLVEYRRFGFPVWPDEITGYAGPLAGLHAGLSHCDTPYMVSVPCDTPGFPIDLVERLAFALRMAAAEVACAVTGESQAPELHPVFCLLKRELLPSLEAYLRAGHGKVAGWLQQQNYTQAHFSDQAAFMNLNTQDDLRAFISERRT